MDTPTAENIREWSKVPFDRLGFAAGTPDPLERLVAVGIGLFEQLTGRKPDATWPTDLSADVAGYVIQRITEILAYQGQKGYVATLGDFQLLSSFSAGSYSESRRSLTELRDAQMIVGDPALNAALWSLMTPEMRDFWWAWLRGEVEPAWGVTEVDWEAGYALADLTVGPDGLSGFPDRVRYDGVE